MLLDSPVIDNLPPARAIRRRLGDALREVQLLRGLLRIAERAEFYKEHDQKQAEAQTAGNERRCPMIRRRSSAEAGCRSAGR